MLRLLFAGALLLAGILYFFLSGGSDSKVSGSGATQEIAAQEAPAGREGTGTSGGLARPLRMQSHEDVEPVGPEGEAGAVAVKRVETSLAQAFAAEAVDRGVVAQERDAMIRSVIAELKEKEVGDAKITAVECRSQHCVLQLASDESPAFFKLLDALQDERGFLGKCESLMLSREGDAISVYLRFPEPESGMTTEPVPTK